MNTRSRRHLLLCSGQSGKMSAIQQFSMSALAGLMIEESPEENEESSYLEDEDYQERAALNITDKSMASTQYSADYETEEFEQESLCASPPQQTRTEDEFPDNLEPLISQGDLEPDSSALTGSTTSGSGSGLNYSDSQYDNNSSRTMHAMPPENKFPLSPIGPSGRADVRTVNYNDLSLQEITGIQESSTERHAQSNDRDNSFEHGQSHSLVQSSPLSENRGKNSSSSSHLATSNPSHQQVKPMSALQSSSGTPLNTTHVEVTKMAYGRQFKGYSTVTKLNAADVKKVCASVGTSSGSDSGSRRKPSQAVCNGEHNLNPGDIKLMREVRNVLNKIEQGDAVSQEVQKVSYVKVLVIVIMHFVFYMCM